MDRIVVENGAWNRVDAAGRRTLLRPGQDWGFLSDSLAAVKAGDGWEICDRNGKPVQECRFEAVRAFYSQEPYGSLYDGDGSAVAVRLAGKWGYLSSRDGSWISPCRWDGAGAFSEIEADLARVCLDGKYGMINKQGELVIPCRWDDVRGFSEGLAAVRQGDQWGYIDQSGILVIPCRRPAGGTGSRPAGPESEKEMAPGSVLRQEMAHAVKT